MLYINFDNSNMETSQICYHREVAVNLLQYTSQTQTHAHPLYHRRKEPPVPIGYETGWASDPLWSSRKI